jgi:hypothetical protein
MQFALKIGASVSDTHKRAVFRLREGSGDLAGGYSLFAGKGNGKKANPKRR